MKILIAGASGFLGKSLSRYLIEKGYSVVTLSRKDACIHTYDWNPDKNYIHENALQDIDCVINLCGANIADYPWTTKRKQIIYNSRISSTKTITSAIQRAHSKSLIFINASAIGIYKEDTMDDITETSPLGNSFLANVCKDWEEAVHGASDTAARTCSIRLGMILEPSGGALKKMLLPFRLGLGCILGDGSQYMSWISLLDAIRAIEYCIKTPELRGPINLTSPTPVTNKEFSYALAAHFNTHVYFRIPRIILSALPGNMGKELFLFSYKVLPKKLTETGFIFTSKTIYDILDKK